MNKKEIQDILDELHTVRPEMLDEKGKRLFEAIMKIADERDLYFSIIKEVREYIKFLKEHYKELKTSPIEDSYFINDMLRQMFIQSIENYLVGIEDILEKEEIK